MAQPPILTLRNATLGFGGKPLFRDLELAVPRGDRLCLVGRNGCGKSTLLKVMAGRVELDSGDFFLQPGTRVAYMEQDPQRAADSTVHAWVAEGLGPDQAGEDWRVAAVLDGLSLDGERATATLSGGEWRRAALARALVGEPDVLLLDEPTNHMDLPTILWLEERLRAFQGAVVTISHDRAFLRSISRRTAWLDRGTLRLMDQNFAHFDTWQEEVLAAEAKELQRMDTRLAQEMHWLHHGVTARRKRNQRRLKDLESLRAERARRKAEQPGQVRMTAGTAEASGKVVVEAENIAKSFDGRPVIRDFSTRILRGDRVGVIGPNGAGKSTLLSLLTGELEPDSGDVRPGTNIQLARFDQHRESLDPDATPWKTLAGDNDTVYVNGQAKHVVGYLRDFLFEERQAHAPIRSLSGGERNRLLLARILAQPSNLLVLDEPTNDLDMETLDLLQEVLSDYQGTLLLVSHDRDFLDRLVTSVIAVEGDGRVGEYAGGYQDYLRQRGEETGKKDSGAKKGGGKAKSDKGGRAGGQAKLSYKEKREMADLEKEIEQLQGDVADLETTLADPELYSRDPDAFQDATTRLNHTRERLEQAEERWLELEMKRDALAAGES